MLKHCAISGSLHQRGLSKVTLKKARLFSLFAIFFYVVAIWYFFDKNIEYVDSHSFFIAVLALVLSGMAFSYISDKINRNRD